VVADRFITPKVLTITSNLHRAVGKNDPFNFGHPINR